MATTRRERSPEGKALQQALADLGGVVGKVGWFKTAEYSNGVPVALVAAVNEFGWPEHNIPPRLGMRATAERMQGQWSQIARTLSGRVIRGQMTAAEAMDLLGQKAAGDVRKNITTVTQPPLKPSTVRARLAGKDQGNVVSITIAKPLVDSAHMLNTLTNTVERE